MPRPANPDKEQRRLRTERWRQRRRSTGRPEASIVDRAVAASFSVFLASSLRDPEEKDFTLRDVVAGAQRLLVQQGYDKRESNMEMMRRMMRRADLPRLDAIINPHENVRRK
ncbi:hypothetical protein [Rhizobium sp. P007]|uniref:hypothetical protein n=1 Tax=Rhizobium sp. P007 TaxID=285908 RepID=UPI001158525C|nr:hypothetical protein [Rhizobium sp. P007]